MVILYVNFVILKVVACLRSDDCVDVTLLLMRKFLVISSILVVRNLKSYLCKFYVYYSEDMWYTNFHGHVRLNYLHNKDIVGVG